MMSLALKIARCLVVVATCGWTSLTFAQRMHPGPYCGVVDGGCAPRRVTYGYYPTCWRRWPTDHPTPAAPPPIETVPKGKQESAPAEEPTQPQLTPEQDMTVPEPTRREPGIDTSPLPFDDQPTPMPSDTPSDPGMPSVPGTTPSTTPSTAPQDDLPTLPPPLTPPGTEDAPPSMPLDDPFKDDPPEPPKSSAADIKQHARRSARDEVSAEPPSTSPRWRVTAQDLGEPTESQAREASPSREPALLPKFESAKRIEKSGPAMGLLSKQNPLRVAAVAPREPQVVPTSWTNNPVRASGASVERRNPLRER